MILDTSALIAILRDEDDAPDHGAALADAEHASISAATLVELGIVMEMRGGPDARARLDTLLARLALEVVPFTADHAALALEGWRRFGKGRHPASLNLGDCFCYALAKARGEALLFKGDDFARTDIDRAA